MRTHHAFTLIELLVVMGIIGVLAGLVLPMSSAIKESSKQNACISNMGLINQGIMAYVNDWQGCLPGTLQIKGMEDGLFQYMGMGNNRQTASNVAKDFVSSSLSKCPKVYAYYNAYPTPPGDSSSTIAKNISAGYGPNWNLRSYQSDVDINAITKASQILAQSRFGLLFCGDAQWNCGQGVYEYDYNSRGAFGPQFMHKSKIIAKNASAYTYTATKGPVVQDGYCVVMYADGHTAPLTCALISGSDTYDETKQLGLAATPTGLTNTATQKSYQFFWNRINNSIISKWAP